MAILNIETSTSVCSVALTEHGKILFDKESVKVNSHSSQLGVFVDEAIKESVLAKINIDAVAVSSGPGSYTGLRIGVSITKGLCLGWNIPLIGISTLQIMAHKVISTELQTDNKLFCSMIDARRMEVYSSIYNNSLNVVRDIKAEIIDENSYIDLLKYDIIYFFGNGSTKCKDVIKSSNAVFVDGVYPSAKDMMTLSEQAFNLKQFEDTAYFEPFYLKDFVAVKAKNKVLSSD
jgi:tRNA threonylcarbamoyladenosine biosynthesis protein TsaB